MLESFTYETFLPLAGQTFVLVQGSYQLEVRLAEATPLGSEPLHPSAERRPFSLLFRGPPQPVWGQGMYQVISPGLGTFQLFLVPLGLDGSAMRYEAVFT